MTDMNIAGSWFLSDQNDGIGEHGGIAIDAIDPADGLLFEVCEVWGVDRCKELDERARDHARLIAAAPSLLEALEATVAVLEAANNATGVCCCGDAVEGHGNPMEVGRGAVDSGEYYAHEAIKQARAAIASARGEH